ncbi:M28 family peptidase [Danxiaibacter flavus]|uniref:M28 family peptidase n=1 Tax=Danxiaibacter flavus TaxID=3049108 RepID=A0ABV3ZGI5_9BACT|nr:M28 family peptidase [Chitinophagaceae bacterium DXS]
MKILLVAIVLVPVLTFGQSRKQRKAEEKENKTILTNLQAHVKYLADDARQGRRAGTQGELDAMDYISRQFGTVGLEPKGDNNFVQEFDINEGKQYDRQTTTLSVNGAALKPGIEFIPIAFSANSSADGTSSIGVREKGEPWFYDLKDILEDNKNNPHFDVDNAIQNEAKKVTAKGAKALLVINTSTSEDNVQFNKYDTTEVAGIPVVYITKDALQKYFPDNTGIYDLKLSVSLQPRQRKAHNVIGYINNSAGNTIIIGAHYDHLGFGEDGNALDSQGQVHNGADDNASGTAGLIEIARILKASSAKSNNYLFIAFSAEELGLLGSKYWLSHPTIAITPNYMINMDMIGRYDTAKKLTIGGYGTSPVWSQVISTVNSGGFVLHFDSSGTGPSDHSSFYHKNIPVLFFFTNTHSDYHKSTDDWDKINYTGEVGILRYIQHIIEATDKQGKLAFLQTREQEVGSVNLPVTLGVMPDYAFTGKGMRIDGVSKGKIAERAGLQGGDILTQLGDYKFIDVVTYMKALQHFKKGDKTTLYVTRDSKEITFNIEF